jgi:hypothetical protein
MGNVYADELTGFSQRPELSPGAHDAALDGAALVAALCRSTTRLGTTTLINESMVPMVLAARIMIPGCNRLGRATLVARWKQRQIAS